LKKHIKVTQDVQISFDTTAQEYVTQYLRESKFFSNPIHTFLTLSTIYVALCTNMCILGIDQIRLNPICSGIRRHYA